MYFWDDPLDSEREHEATRLEISLNPIGKNLIRQFIRTFQNV